VSCVFCDIVAGEAEANVVLDEPHAFAFLDRRPLFSGHTLLVPREHHETITDLPPDQVDGLFRTAQRLAAAVRDGMGAQGTFMAVNNTVSQSVPHLHIHIVPRTKGDGLRGFFWPRIKYAATDEAERAAAQIRAALSSS
jgi:histidine triad (HIT) family protein